MRPNQLLLLAAFTLSLGACDVPPVDEGAGAPAAATPGGDVAEGPSPGPALAAENREIAALFGAMEAMGPQSEQRYHDALRPFVESPDGAVRLIAFYDRIPSEGHLARWKTVNAVMRMDSDEVVPFLERVALSEDAPAAASLPGGAPGDREEGSSTKGQVKRQAAVGVAFNFIHNKKSASGAVDKLLKTGPREIALAVAVELFSANKLSSAHAKILSQRRFPSRFAMISRSKQLARLKVAAPTKPSGAQIRAAALSTPPALKR
jgi:hypothetical protein